MSDQWVAEYEKLVALQKKYSPPQDVADQMVGAARRLQSMIPAGYHWDDSKRRRVQNPPPPTPPAPKK